jgi:predicted nucleotidyltransferase
MTETTADRLLGTKEAAASYGVNVPNFIRDWASRPDFPAPAASLARGRVWRAQDLLAYRAATAPKRGVRRNRLLLSPEAQKALPVIKRRIVRRFKPEQIILFGSQARGEANQYSDIDLLVVMPPMSDAKAASRGIRAAASGLPIDTEVIVTTRSELIANIDLIGSVLRPAIREGITIYARS